MANKGAVDGLPEKLASARKSAGLTQAQASANSGVGQGMLSQFESGKQTPTLATLIKLAKAYGVDPCDLIPREPAPAKAPPKSNGKPKK